MPAIAPKTLTKKPDSTASKVPWGPASAILFTVVVYLLSQLLGSLIILAYAKVQGMDHAEITRWTSQTWPQFFYIFLVEGLTLGLIWAFIKRRKANFKTLGLRKIHWKDLGFTLIGFGIYLPALLLVFGLARWWFPQINFDQPQQLGFETSHGLNLVLVFISLVMLPPFTEEVVARGFLYSGLKSKLPIIWAALITSVMFASAHLEFGSGAPLLWAAAIDTFILSLVLIWLREKTGGLWSSIGLHMLKNAIAFAALFIFVK